MNRVPLKDEKIVKDVPVKVLFIHSSSEMYGSDRCLYELVKRIDRNRFTPVCVLPFEGALSKRLRSLHVTVYITDPWVLRKGTFRSLKFISYILNLPGSILKLMRIMKKECISVVYSNTSVIIGSAFSACIMRKPHIYHIRELYDNYPKLARFYKLFLCAFSKKIITISNAASSLVKESCPGKIKVIYDGIELDRFVRTANKIPDTMSEWKRHEFTVVANIGRVSQIKGQELFIHAARESYKHDNKLRFLIVGDVFKGNEQFMLHLQDMVKGYGMQEVVLFTGFREDVDNFMANSDIIVISTLITEGLGQVVMEGMAAGRVVIAPDKGGPLELIENGKDGILYRAGDQHALERALLKAAEDPELRKSIAEKAVQKAEKQFGIHENVTAIEQVIRDAATAPADSSRLHS